MRNGLPVIPPHRERGNLSVGGNTDFVPDTLPRKPAGGKSILSEDRVKPMRCQPVRAAGRFLSDARNHVYSAEGRPGAANRWVVKSLLPCYIEYERL